MISSTRSADSFTVANASSGSYALRVMTIVAALLTPLVLLYQGWSYWVVLRRVHPAAELPQPAAPLAVTGSAPSRD